jgi:hypothetical protein
MTPAVRGILPSLHGSIDASDPGHNSQYQTDDKSPWCGFQEIHIDDPSKPAPDDQRSQQFRSDSNGLTEPRIQGVLWRGHPKPTEGESHAAQKQNSADNGQAI